MSKIELLFDAVSNNDIEQIKELLELGFDINQPTEDGYTALMNAAAEGHLGIVKLLVEAGANANIVTFDGEESALAMAALGNWYEIYEYLVPSTSAENKVRADKLALTTAAIDGEPSTITFLIQQGANLDVQLQNEEGDGETALIIASRFSNVQYVKALVEFGADLNVKDNLGRTALMKAATFRNSTESGIRRIIEKKLKIVRLLVEAGADLSLKDSEGKTVFDLATEFGCDQLVSGLLGE